MHTLVIYMVESAVCVSALYAVYWFFLRRDTFFHLNRFYLLAMVLFSLVAPLLPYHFAQTGPVASVAVLLEPVIITPEKVEQSLMDHLQWAGAVMVVYLTGAAVFLLRFLVQLIQLYRLTRRFGFHDQQGRHIVPVDKGYSPFSFFNFVYINNASAPEESLQTILDHEQVHIRQWHSADLILIELVTILQWFNPVIWLAGREMKSIHEYLADEGVLQNGISRQRYQQMILNESMGIQVNNLANNFNVSILKKRIAMMTKSKSKNWARSKVLLALPALLALLFLLTARSYSNPDVLNDAVNAVVAPVHLVPAPHPVVQEKQKKESQIKFVAPVVQREVFTVVEKEPSYPGGQEGRIKFLVENIKYPEKAVKDGVMGTVYVTFVVEKDGAVTNVKVLRGIGSGCDEEAIRVVKMMPNWNPGEQKGKPVAVQYNLPIKFTLDCKKKEEPKK
ncbi:MAG: TonB family protein [Bacteroidales bacterium]